MKEGGFGLTPSPAIPSSVSGDTSPVPGMLSGGHAQKLLRAGKEQMGKDATSNTGVWPAAAFPASPGPQLCPPTELQRTGNNTKPLSQGFHTHLEQLGTHSAACLAATDAQPRAQNSTKHSSCTPCLQGSHRRWLQLSVFPPGRATKQQQHHLCFPG